MREAKLKYLVGGLCVLVVCLGILAVALEMWFDPSVYVTSSQTRSNGNRVVVCRIYDDFFSTGNIASMWDVSDSGSVINASHHGLGWPPSTEFTTRLPANYRVVGGIGIQKGSKTRLPTNQKTVIWVLDGPNGGTIKTYARLSGSATPKVGSTKKPSTIPETLYLDGGDAVKD